MIEWLSDHFIQIIGALVIGVTLLLITGNRTVSAGHSIVLAAGAFLLALPFISTVEWSEKGFKFVRREEAAEIAGEVRKNGETNALTNDKLNKVIQALDVANQRIALLEGQQKTPATPSTSGKLGGQDGGGEMPSTLDWKQYTAPDFFKTLSNETGNLASQSRGNAASAKALQDSITKPVGVQ